MHELVLDGRSFSVPMVPLITNCHIFQENKTLIGQRNYEARSRVSLDAFRVFLGAIEGSEPAITADNVGDLAFLSDEFKFVSLAKAVADWQAAHPTFEAGARLMAAAIEDRLMSHDRAICALDRKVDRLQQAAICDMEGMLRQQQTAIGDVRSEASHDRATLSGLSETISDVQSESERLAAELTESRRREDELTSRVQELREFAEGLRRQMESVVAAMRETNSSVKQEFASVRRDIAKLREEIRAKESAGPQLTPLKPSPPPSPNEPTTEVSPATPKQGLSFPPSVTKGKTFDVPNGIIAHLTKQYGGNVHDQKAINVTSAAPYGNSRNYLAKYVADLETEACYASVDWKGTMQNERNNWICYDFKNRRIVPTHYAIRSSNSSGAGSPDPKSWLVETSTDGKTWKEVDRREDNADLRPEQATQIFAAAGGEVSRFIRLVNIGMNHCGDTMLSFEAWEIFGELTE